MFKLNCVIINVLKPRNVCTAANTKETLIILSRASNVKKKLLMKRSGQLQPILTPTARETKEFQKKESNISRF